MLQIKLSAIKTMEAFARRNPDIISLSQGGLKLKESNLEIKEAVKEILHSNKADYYGHGMGLLELREKLAQNLSEKHGDVPVDQIIVTHGCNGALSVLALLLFEEGDEIILPEPAYPSYTNLCQITRSKPVYVSSLDDDSNEFKWHLPIEKIKASTTEKTKAILFSNPTNPTSTMISKDDLLSLISWCEQKGIYLIIDEVYEDYIFDGEFQSATPFIKNSKYLIKASSFSKNFALSGWRVGYMIIPKHLVEMAHIMQDSLLIAPTLISQYAALAALNNPQIAARFQKQLKINRDITLEKLNPLMSKGIIKFEKPSAGFYVFIKTSHEDASDLCLDLIEKASVSLVPGVAFGPSSKSYMRLCFARNQQVLEEGLRRLTGYWE